MKRLLTNGLLLMALAGTAQQKIKPEDAAKHVGDSLTVCGKVYAGKYLANGTSKVTLLDMGGLYPNNTFTVVLPQALREKLASAPEITYKDKDVCFTGKIVLYKEKPQMVLDNPQQIVTGVTPK